MKTSSSNVARCVRKLLAVMALLPALSGHAAPGMFMKLDGVEAWLPVTGVVSEIGPANAIAPGTVAVRVSKPFDAASPLLLQACGGEGSLRRLTLAWRDDGDTVFRITMENVIVSDMTWRLSSGVPAETGEAVSLRGGTFEWSWFGPNGAETAMGGTGLKFDAELRKATLKSYLPFRAALEAVSGRSVELRLTCPVERGRAYRISASTTLDGNWVKLEDFTAEVDGLMERHLPAVAGRLFLRVEALD